MPAPKESSRPLRVESSRVERTCSCGHSWLGRATDACPVCRSASASTGDEILTKNLWDNDLKK